MLNNQITINWNQAQQISKEANQNTRKEQAKYLNEFRTSICDMFDILDWQHYADKTGWSITDLRAHAKFNKDEDYVKKSIYSMLGSEVDEDDLYAFNF